MADIFNIYMKQPVEYHLPELEDQKEKKCGSQCMYCLCCHRKTCDTPIRTASPCAYHKGEASSALCNLILFRCFLTHTSVINIVM